MNARSAGLPVKHDGVSVLRGVVVAALLGSALAVGPSLSAAQAALAVARGRRATPQLLDEAVARGEIDRATADLHLAGAFARTGAVSGVPARYRSDVPWDGTLPLLHLTQRLTAQPASRSKFATQAALAAATTCHDSTAALPNEITSTHFYLNYGTIGGGLLISDYVNSLETTWTKEVTSYGWAAPPSLATPPPAPIGTKYPVRVDNLSPGLYGFVGVGGTGAGFVGNNPKTTWNDGDAYATCMVLNTDFALLSPQPMLALQATAAHEFNHSIQYGYGALSGPNTPDDSLIEGGATWMEDEVFDGANDNYSYLWPNFGDSLGAYDPGTATVPGDPYPFWLMVRGLTERFGTGVTPGGEQVMQDFWEETSKGTGNNLSALATGLANKGVSLPTAYNDFAIAAGFMKPCGGGYALPYCFKEAAGYVAAAGGLPPVAGSISTTGGFFSSSVKDDYSLAWVGLPASSTYPVILTNTSGGGQLQATVVCDNGSTLVRTGLPAIVGAGQTTTLSSFSSAGCIRTLAVVTNTLQSPGNPLSATDRTFTLSTGTPPPPPDGYRLVAGDGGIFSFGPRTFHGSTGAITLAKPIVGGATNPVGVDGYWIVASDGGVFAFNVPFFGSLGGRSIPAPAVAIEPTPAGRGYWIVLANGSVVGFGDATTFGDLASLHLNKPVISMSSTPTGRGYWIVSGDGGVFSFGDARFFGSTGGLVLNAPIVSLAPTPDGGGYYLVATDGGVFSFGTARFKGSTGGTRLNSPVIAMMVAPVSGGYWLAASDGGVFTFGAPFLGSVGGIHLNSPILDMIA